MDKKEFEFRNRNGKRIQGTLRTTGAGQKGTFVLLHGLGGWKDQPALVAIADAVCEIGYVVVTFNGADGAAAPDGDFFNNTNTGYVEDVEDVFSWLQSKAEFPQPYVLGGHSQGGLVALRYASEHPEHITKVVLAAPAVAWYSGLWLYWPIAVLWLIRGKHKWPGSHNSFQWLGRGWLLDFLKFDGYADAKKVSVPVLIVSAGRDHTVGKPFIHRALAKRFTNSTWKVVKEAKHSFPDPEHAHQLAGIITTWLIQN